MLPKYDCHPQNVESDSIKACICTTDYCTGLEDGQSHSTNTITQAPRHQRTLSPRIEETLSPRIDQQSSRYTTESTSSFRRISSTEASFGRQPQQSGPVRCHQCGRLFSRDGNSACTEFDEYDDSQQGYCKEGEACLWYSWQKSRSSQAYVRECFSKSIVLGTVDNPLVAKPYCDPIDISENSISRVTACLCETDLCNAFRSAGEKPQPRVNQQSSEPKASQSNRRHQDNDSQSNRRHQDNDSQSNRRHQENIPQSNRNREDRFDSQNSIDRQSNPSGSREIEETPRSPNNPPRLSANQVHHPDKTGLQCFSCGSLLNPDAKCDEFSPTNISMTQTCLKGESCLMYTWKKSSTETGMTNRYLLSSNDNFLFQPH